MKLTFLGANRQVTGSSYLLEAGGLRVLIDCGMFQERKFLDRNWKPLGCDPPNVDVMLLTHAHLDHCGLIPKLVNEGFKGDIFTAAPTCELAELVMTDSGHIQEEDAAYKRKRHQREGRKARHPEQPLYTQADAQRAAGHLKPVPLGEPVRLNDRVTARFRCAGHILGSASIALTVREGGAERTIVFSGDIGQWAKPLVNDPAPFDQADYVVIESTYGDREHDDHADILTTLADVINRAQEAGGNVLIPAFAIERSQELLFYLGRLWRRKMIEPAPVFLDSPMAIRATETFNRFREILDAEAQDIIARGGDPLDFPGLQFTRTAEQSKSINAIRGTAIIVAGSGMCTGGRIKHHMVHNVTRQESVMLFVGYQAPGTLGRVMLDRPEQVRLHGRPWPLRCKVEQLHGMSAHGDQDDLLRWIGALQNEPRTVFVTHGEERAAKHLAGDLHQQHQWRTVVPGYGQRVDLD